MIIYDTFKGYNQLSEVAIATDDALKAFVSFVITSTKMLSYHYRYMTVRTGHEY